MFNFNSVFLPLVIISKHIFIQFIRKIDFRRALSNLIFRMILRSALEDGIYYVKFECSFIILAFPTSSELKFIQIFNLIINDIELKMI